MLQKIAGFLRCVLRQGLGNSLYLYFRRSGRTTLTPRGHKSPFTLRANTADVAAFQQVFVHREYDHQMLTRIDPAQIIDAGAHIGGASVFFATRFPEARIIAIEPDAANFQLLVQNTKYYKNVVPVHAALWSEDALVGLSNPRGLTWSVRVNAGHETPEVRGMTVLTLLKEFNISRIDILKMDIEGTEKEIFEGNASEWLGKVGLLCIELHDRFRPGTTRAFYSKAVAFQFIKENSGELDFLLFC
jgi:FkbM family methyltransferase